jgi:hexosaminidase
MAVCFACVVGSVSAGEAPQPSLVPLPVRVEFQRGSFTLDASARIVAEGEAKPAAALLAAWLSGDTGIAPAVAEPGSRGGAGHSIMLRIAATLPPEAYSLRVTPEGIEIEAATHAGLVYGCQTLRQLLRRQRDAWTAPAVTIADRPRLRWRGLMLDCSRTFIGLPYLRRTVDLLSFYKLNVLHLHLTDDQGWRMEIKSHPKLTDVGAHFASRFAGETGGYYTQQELRELVRHAAERGVTIVPEIEMPGHATAALAAYPEFSCTGGPFEIFPFFQGPGVTEDVFCPGNEHTFELLADVLKEVAAVFPGTYVHVGGDECPTTRWRACPRCRARMRAEGLRDVAALQNYFVRRAVAMVESSGKKVIGWDEIAQADMSAGAAVMFWRGLDGVSALARAGHDVVLSPTEYCYLDYRQSSLPQEQGEGGRPVPLDKVYSFDPVPESLDAAAAAHILGIQGNLWTHYARSEEAMDRQIYPRLLALAEAGWTPQAARQWQDFSERLRAQCGRLRNAGVRLGLNFQPDAAVWAEPASGKH